jgi:hypothetical protein
MARGKISESKLSYHLAKVGEEMETVLDDGTPVTKEEALARLLYKKALGWTEKRVVEDDYGNKSTVEDYHPPENWAVQAIWDRREGRPTPSQSDADKKGMSASEKVRELAKKRMSKITQATARPGPPKHKPDA